MWKTIYRIDFMFNKYFVFVWANVLLHIELVKSINRKNRVDWLQSSAKRRSKIK